MSNLMMPGEAARANAIEAVSAAMNGVPSEPANPGASIKPFIPE